ncbi:hypothetical protein BCR33DRAFT_718449, partial [Rhizoclosmatium globosum]
MPQNSSSLNAFFARQIEQTMNNVSQALDSTVANHSEKLNEFIRIDEQELYWISCLLS